MHITRLKETNFKRVESVDIAAGNRAVVVLRGPNESGKTSAIDAIIAALGGKSKSPELPVRRGAKLARVDVTLGDGLKDHYEVVREWDEDGASSLGVTDLTGERRAKLKAGQTLLDSIVSDLSFDPLAFVKAEPRQQVRMLLSAAGLESAFERAQQEKAAAAEQRAEVNREVRRLEAALKSNPDPSPDAKLQRVSDEQIAADWRRAEEHNRNRDQASAAIERTRKDLASIQGRIDDLKAQIALAEKELDRATERLTSEKSAYQAMEPEIPTAALQDRIRQMREGNAKADQQELARGLAEQLKKEQVESDRLTAVLETIDAELVAKLDGSSIGERVPGLLVKDGAVWHNGVPLSQASGMRKLELSCLIGMAANPTVKVMLIDEADKLDDGAMGRITELAKDRGYQLWMTGVRIGDAENPDQHICEMANGSAVEAGEAVAHA